MGSPIKLAHFSPGRFILLSFFIAITISTILLSLPIAQATQTPIPFIDLLFTATSAACVTGLFTIPLTHFTLFGKAIILVLIQIGGLGLITLMLFGMYMIINVGLATQLMAGQLLEIESWKNVKKILLFIFLFTLLVEIIGAFSILAALETNFPCNNIWFLSLFHAISSFCNAGIPLLYETIPATMQSKFIIAITTMLMFIGGLGFITWYEIARYIKSLPKKKKYRFSLHSKIILYGSTTLLISSSIIFWILERENVLALLNAPTTMLESLFYAVSFKSTGLLLVPPAELHLATVLLIMIISFIGSSPGSTGSGIKITNFAIFLATVKAAIINRRSVEIQGRRIAKDQVNKAIAIISLGLSWIILITFCLLITEKNILFIDILFEAVAAFTTLGITTGVTPALSLIGKIFIIMSMIIGRVGSLTLILGIKFKKKGKETEFSYPEERVMLG
jgi:trk/ktr system potassium uptake protein